MKIILSIIFSSLLIIGILYLMGVSQEKQKENSLTDSEIIDTVINNFLEVAKIPRPSHHEEKISQFLMDFAKNQGLNPVRDDYNNVMYEIPATKGLENKPLGIIQAHMDMVVAVEKDKDFNPLNDSITTIRDDVSGKLTAIGTSLGADDGIGLSIIMAVTQGKMTHGKLRMIITTNEEDDMSGAFHVSSSWLENASFLINVDNEWSTQILVSTASSDTLNASKNLEYQNPSGNKAIQIEISNLKGGHSGVEIDKGRLNGIIALAKFLKDLNTQKIDYELSSFEGGVAPNAIPTEAKAILVIDSTNLNTIKQKMEEYCAALNKTYEKTENEIICTITEFSNIPKIVSSTEKITLINVLTDVIDGIYTMSKDMEGLVESSSNLGKVNMSPLSESVEIITTIRSSNPEKETEKINQQKNLALSNGFTNNDINIEHTADAWQFDPNSKLAELAKTIYKRQNKEDAEVVAVHAGVECGRFKNLKKELDMISIGPDITDAHTIRETLYMNSIPRVWNLLEGILESYPNI